MKNNIKIAHMQVAKIYSELSYCIRKKVGCILVKDNRVISIGYNGTPSGQPNICEDLNGNTLESVIHAEKNAIIKLQNDKDLIKDSSLFVTTCPCFQCSELIIEYGIKEVYYNEEYRINKGLENLINAGIRIEKVII